VSDLVLPFTIVQPTIFLRFGIAALLIELTPGPNMGYLAIVARQRGRRAGLLVVIGIAIGLSCYLALAVVGVAKGLLADHRIYQALRWSGIAYMLWLAADAWRAEPLQSAAAPGDDIRLLGRGLLTNLLNVKAAIFYAVLLPAFLDVARGLLWLQACILGGTHVFIATAVHVSIVMIAARGDSRSAESSSYAGRAYAVGLVAVAIWLAWSTRRPA
jgi:threonine/homoserine/homoserine lactone efflux protein